MRRPTASTLLIVAVVAVVVSPLAAALGGAAAGNGVTTAQQQQENGTDGPTLEDLRAGGDQPSGAPPSVRASGTYSEYALKHLPTGLFTDESDVSQWRYLERGEDVKRDTVQLWSKRGYGVEEKEVTVRVAHFRTAQRDNETVATNVTTYQIDATLGGGYDRIDVDLRSHYRSSYRTVVCVDEPGEPNCLSNPNGVRWRFNHETSAAMQGVDINSEGDKIAWGLSFMLLPFFGSALSSMFGARKAIKAAKSKPRIPWWVWPVLLVASFVMLFAFWDQVVATSVRAPWALSVIGGLAIGLVAAVWFGDDRRTSLLLRLRPDEFVDSPAASTPQRFV